MIKCIVGNNVKRVPIIVPPATTLREAMGKAGFSYDGGTLTLNGATMAPGDLDKSFEEHGIKTECWLIRVTKADNAGM